MIKVTDLDKLHKGQVVRIDGTLSVFGGCHLVSYCIFLGFAATDISALLESALSFSVNGEQYDVCNVMNQINFIVSPKFLQFYSCFSPVDTKDLVEPLKNRFNEPYKDEEVLTLSKSVCELKDAITEIVPLQINEQELKQYIIKSELSKQKKLYQLNKLVDSSYYMNMIREKYINSKNVEISGLDNLVPTKTYKPRHFYILKTPKSVRLYYCLLETKKTGKFFFSLLYNSETYTEVDKANMLDFILNCKSRFLLCQKKIRHYRVIENKTLYEIPNVEAVEQSLNCDLWFALSNDVLFSYKKKVGNICY